MKEFFGYIYYRLNKVYFKWDGRRGITSILAISMIQFIWPFIALLLVSRFAFTPSELAPFKSEVKYAACIIFIMLYFFNYKVYSQNYNAYKNKWRNEGMKQKKQRGVGIILLLALPWMLLPIIINSTL